MVLDVIVIGGGPAGSTASTLIAQQGYKVQAVRARAFSAFSYRRVADSRDLLGAQAAEHARQDEGEPLRQEVQRAVRQRQGQALRAVLFHGAQAARMLANLAGAAQRVRQDDARTTPASMASRPTKACACWKCCSTATEAMGVRIQDEDGTQREVLAKVVVDASGQSALIANRFKLRVIDPDLKKGAVWTYFEGAYRDVGRDEGATIVLQTADKKGWFWYIPLHNNIVSVGIVSAFDYLFAKGRGDHETIYNEELERCPAVKERVAIGRRVAGFYATKDYSYRSSQVAGRVGCWSATRLAFSIRCTRSGVLLALKCGPTGRRRHDRRAWARNDLRPSSSASGGPTSARAWIACGGWCANSTTASASAASCASIRTTKAI